jgi:hypothetical protein
MEDERDTLWVKVYDGEGDNAKLIFEGTARQWEIFRTTHNWDAPKGTPPKKTEKD